MARFCSTIMRPFGLLLALSACGGRSTQGPGTPSPPVAPVAWADEFDGAAGSSPDPTRWTYDLGNNGGWGNGELQQYTATSDNAHLDGQGHLVIRVESTPSGYTSARLKTRGLRVARYGRVEARLKLPVGRGLWPAFWMLGDSFNGSNWPECGEIDVMESIGSVPSVVLGTVHGPQYSGAGGITGRYELPPPASFSDDFHVFAVDWQPALIQFLVDNTVYHRVTPVTILPGAPWVFNQPFFLLLNVAVGGNLPGPPDDSTSFPQEMVVDYVRYVP